MCGPLAPTLKMGCRRGERIGYALRIRSGAQALLRTSILNSSDERRCPKRGQIFCSVVAVSTRQGATKFCVVARKQLDQFSDASIMSFYNGWHQRTIQACSDKQTTSVLRTRNMDSARHIPACNSSLLTHAQPPSISSCVQQRHSKQFLITSLRA